MSAVSAELSTFQPWRTFRIGGVPKRQLLHEVKADFNVSWRAESMVERPVFTTLDAEELIDTIILTVANLGFTHRPLPKQVLDPARLRAWTEQNAESIGGRTVELLPAETALHIRRQFMDQENGEELWMAMEPISSQEGPPCVFTVARDVEANMWLDALWAWSGSSCHLDGRVVLRLR